MDHPMTDLPKPPRLRHAHDPRRPASRSADWGGHGADLRHLDLRPVLAGRAQGVRVFAFGQPHARRLSAEYRRSRERRAGLRLRVGPCGDLHHSGTVRTRARTSSRRTTSTAAPSACSTRCESVRQGWSSASWTPRPTGPTPKAAPARVMSHAARPSAPACRRAGRRGCSSRGRGGRSATRRSRPGPGWACVLQGGTAGRAGRAAGTAASGARPTSAAPRSPPARLPRRPVPFLHKPFPHAPRPHPFLKSISSATVCRLCLGKKQGTYVPCFFQCRPAMIRQSAEEGLTMRARGQSVLYQTSRHFCSSIWGFREELLRRWRAEVKGAQCLLRHRWSSGNAASSLLSIEHPKADRRQEVTLRSSGLLPPNPARPDSRG